jgi:hypothetical protein
MDIFLRIIKLIGIFSAELLFIFSPIILIYLTHLVFSYKLYTSEGLNVFIENNRNRYANMTQVNQLWEWFKNLSKLKKSMIIIGLLAVIGFVNRPDVESQTKQKEEAQTVDGTYSYKDNSAELVITIGGNSWSGKTMMVTGFGSDYDNRKAQYDNGIVKGNDLYESSGMVKVGYVNGNSLTTSVGGQSVTLRKN